MKVSLFFSDLFPVPTHNNTSFPAGLERTEQRIKMNKDDKMVVEEEENVVVSIIRGDDQW